MDEYLYWLWPHEIKTHVPIIERLMIEGMQNLISHTKVGVETTCMLHWNKKAPCYNELTWDANGLPILEEPPFVQELHKALEAQKESTHD